MIIACTIGYPSLSVHMHDGNLICCSIAVMDFAVFAAKIAASALGVPNGDDDIQAIFHYPSTGPTVNSTAL